VADLQARNLLGLALGVVVALAGGLWDDIRRISPLQKVLWQSLAASVAMAGGFVVTHISNPFGPSLSLGVFAYAATLLWFLGLMNAVSMLDGLDGLAAGVCLFVSLTVTVEAVFFRRMEAAFLSACLGGAALGFLFFNFHPATVSLGNSGAGVLGFLVAALSLRSCEREQSGAALLAPLVALGLPVFDLGVLVLRRWARRLPLRGADRQQIHQALLSMGLSHRNVVLALYGASVGLGAASLLVAVGGLEVTVLVFGALGVMAFVCMRVFGGVRVSGVLTRLIEDRDARWRSDTAKVEVQRALARMARAQSQDEAWAAFCGAAGTLGFDRASLRLANGGVQRWGPPDAETGQDRWRARMAIRCNGVTIGELELSRLYGPAKDENRGAARDEALRRLLIMLGSRPAGGAPSPETRHAAGYRPLVAEAAELADQLRNGLSEAVAGLSQRRASAQDAWARPPRPAFAPSGQAGGASS